MVQTDGEQNNPTFTATSSTITSIALHKMKLSLINSVSQEGLYKWRKRLSYVSPKIILDKKLDL